MWGIAFLSVRCLCESMLPARMQAAAGGSHSQGTPPLQQQEDRPLTLLPAPCINAVLSTSLPTRDWPGLAHFGLLRLLLLQEACHHTACQSRHLSTENPNKPGWTEKLF